MRPRESRSPTIAAGLLALVLATLLPAAARAVPGFARKYDLSCNVCHTREPRLNAFGQRFQENGYQLPATEDGGTTGKRALGDRRHGLTLDSVDNILSARIRADIQQASFRGETEATEDVDFVVPNVLNVFLAGTAAKNIGYFFEMEYAPGAEGEEAGVEFERISVVFSNIGGSHQALNAKVGKFDPSAFFAFPTHRQQMNPVFAKAETDEFPPRIDRAPVLPLAFSSKMFGLTRGPEAAGEEGFSILPFEPYLFNSPAEVGAVLYGRPGNKGFFYQLGVVQDETAEDEPDTRYDYHLMLRYDFGPASHKAGQVSAFYYEAPDAARPTLAPGGMLFFAEPVSWTRYGVGARMQYKFLDIYGTAVWDEIDEPRFAGPPLTLSEWDTDALGASVEVDWLLREDWLLGARYDYLDSGGLSKLPPMLQGDDPEINQDASFVGLIAKYYPATNIGLYVRGHFNLSGSEDLPAALGGGVHPARNLESVIALGIDMAF